jgi:methylglutaconyl-CoA hydratase
MPQVVVGEVAGAAIAGGCALLSACDFVVVAADARLGYPVHRLGVSPAVTIPALEPLIGGGLARTLLMSGELIDGAAAHRLGLATHRSDSGSSVTVDALAFCRMLAAKPPNALRTTKAWLNQLDGSLDDARFDGAAAGSAELAGGAEARTMLTSWNIRPSA